MSRHRFLPRCLLPGVAALVLLAGCNGAESPNDGVVTLLNVSYDPTRELFREVDERFGEQWQAQTGQTVRIRQSHGGSGKQARAVIDGLDADVVTLALAYDIDSIHLVGKRLGADWQTRLPDNSSPYTSPIVFLVRKGNPKGIRDWEDLVRPDVEVITPNPKTSGGARWNYLAAWGYVLHRELGGDFSLLGDPSAAARVAAAEREAEAFITRLYARVPVLDSGARGSTNTFVQRGIGDVLIAWENEALLAVNAMRDIGWDSVEVVVPSLSVLAEPPVAIVDTVVDRKGTRRIAEAYLQFLYSDEGQEIAARNHYRPRNATILAAHAAQFPAMQLFTLDQVFGTWQAVQAKHFADGGIFDRVYASGD